MKVSKKAGGNAIEVKLDPWDSFDDAESKLLGVAPLIAASCSIYRTDSSIVMEWVDWNESDKKTTCTYLDVKALLEGATGKTDSQFGDSVEQTRKLKEKKV